MLLPFLAPITAALLAPGPQELDAATVEMDARVRRMEAIGTALGRVQNAWGEELAAGEKPHPCDDADDASLVARSRAFGAAYRDAVQSARAQLQRLDRILAAPTILPLLDTRQTAYADGIRALVDQHVRIALESESWQSAHVDPTVKGCPIALDPVNGIAYTGAPSTAHGAAVAIIGVGGGLVCPQAVPADGRVVVTDGVACLGASDCSCEPQRVEVATVIGPRAPAPIRSQVPTP
jgi:hypothetical protein